MEKRLLGSYGGPTGDQWAIRWVTLGDDATAGNTRSQTSRHVSQRRKAGASAALERCVADLVNAVDKGVADEVTPYGLIPSEFNLLRACVEDGPCTATQLAEVLPVDASRISRMVTRLVNLGLLRRQRLRSDRRVVLLHLTDKGNDMTSRVAERVQVHVGRLLQGVSEGEMRAFTLLTEKISANYEALKEAQ